MDLSVSIHNNLATPEDLLQWAEQASCEKKWRIAEQRWAVMMHLYPQHPAGWIRGGEAARKLKHYQQSEALLNNALLNFPDRPGALVQLAELYISQKKWKQAIEALELLQSRFPNEIVGYARLADILSMQGDFSAAEEINAQVREKFPKRPRGWSQYAELAMQQENWSEALQRWALMRERFPQHGAGYMRAAVAAENCSDLKLARTLRLAREYGNAWLSDALDEKTDCEHKVNPPQKPGLRQFAELVWTKARFNLKSEANQNYLRYLWWVLDPLLYMAVFYVVFGLLLNRGGDNFVVYLLTGLVPFQWFAKTVQLASGSILAGGGLMHQVRISPMFFPLVMITQTAGKQLLVFGMLFLFLLFYGLTPGVNWAGLIPVIAAQLLLTVVAAAVVAMLIPFARDLTNLVPTGLQFVMFISAVFYSADIVPERWQTLFFLNPMATLLEQYRLILLHQTWPDWQALGWLTLGCGISLAVLLLVYRRLAPVYPRVVIE